MRIFTKKNSRKLEKTQFLHTNTLIPHSSFLDNEYDGEPQLRKSFSKSAKIEGLVSRLGQGGGGKPQSYLVMFCYIPSIAQKARIYSHFILIKKYRRFS